MIQLLIPFVMAAVTIILFYALVVVCLLFDWIVNDIVLLDWGIFEDLMDFFDLFDGFHSTGSWVVAGIIWLALTAFFEILSTDN